MFFRRMKINKNYENQLLCVIACLLRVYVSVCVSAYIFTVKFWFAH